MPEESPGSAAASPTIVLRDNQAGEPPLLAAAGKTDSQPVATTRGWKPPHRTDLGNSDLFASVYQKELRYDHRRGKWLMWRGNWWSEDQKGEVWARAVKVVRLRAQLAPQIEDADARDKEWRWAIECESRARLEAMLVLAQKDPRLADSGADWDGNPWLLGVANGVVDLRTGGLREGRPSDRITIHTAVPFEGRAQAPRFEQFLLEIFGGDLELIQYVQRAIGYSLTGDTSEQCFFVLHGEGANGKSTLLEVLREAAGEYGFNMPFSTVELKARASIPNDMAALAGRRFVTSSETDPSAQINEARMKTLTGQDKVTARFLHREFFTYRPVGKFWLASNYKPLVRDDSHGFWRRVRLIPFLNRFQDTGDPSDVGDRSGTPNARVGGADKDLFRKLRSELPGILAWAVRGCIEWQKRGLGVPPAIREATKSYREEMDSLTEFLEECCILDPDGQVSAHDLWREFAVWAKEKGESLDRRTFSARLQARGFQRVRAGHERTWTWLGLRLNSSAEYGPILAVDLGRAA
ncbi:MAG TPA: phage/plasmid primase, P4 family [Bryobacteraceae bacterium]|nr:phage/plasmid primase, P4 family [Bryobacteraceae bacterium]